MPEPHGPRAAHPSTIDAPVLQPSSPELAPVPGGDGRYAVRAFHARGGIGEVYLADDLELGRFVALKEMQARYAGDAGCRKRFVREAELTGRLEHPGVVPVYGLGAHDDGRPFYAMRFIRGETLGSAIDRYHGTPPGPGRRLLFRELLRRFVAVCHAVAYAHSRRVMHRDLKPDNVMLGEFGETLVVDWGLAKRFGEAGDDGPPSAESTFDDAGATLAGSAIGTPQYMAPEQAAGRLHELGPASDVYSLGATLYTLLTGRTAIGGTTAPEAIADAASGQFRRPRSVNKKVPPALEAVCLKAMALRPTDRYASPGDLAADLDRWLADEPVSCHRDSWLIRLARLARRHRAKFATSVALLASVVAALGVGFILIGREQSKTAAARDQAVAALDEMTSQVVENWLAKQPGKPTADQEKFLTAISSQYEEFARATGGSATARARAANAWMRLGFIRRRLGQKDESLAAQHQAAALYRALAADYPDQRDYRRKACEADHGTGVLLLETDRLNEAEAVFVRVIADWRAFDTAGDPKDRLATALSIITLANAQTRLKRTAEAEANYKLAIDDLSALAAANPDRDDFTDRLSLTYGNLAWLYVNMGRAREALEPAQKALETRRKLVTGPKPLPTYRSQFASAHNRYGNVLRELGQTAKAESVFRDGIAIARRLAADFPAVPEYRDDLARGLVQLGQLLGRSGRVADSEPLFRDGLALRRQLADDFPDDRARQRDLSSAQNDLGVTLHLAGRLDDAEAAYREAIATKRAIAAASQQSDDRNGVCIGLFNLALMLTGSGKHDAAREICAEARAGFDELAKNEPKDVSFRLNLAKAYGLSGNVEYDAGDYPAAAAFLRQAIAVADTAVRDQPTTAIYRQEANLARKNLSRALTRIGQLDEVEPLLRSAAEGHRALLADDPKNAHYRFELADMHVHLSEAAFTRGSVAEAQSALDEAMPLRDAALKANRTNPNYRRLDRHIRRLAAKLAATRGDTPAAVAAAESIAALGYDASSDTIAAARALAICSGLSQGDAARTCGDAAMAQLRAAVSHGYADINALTTDADFAAIRKRPDFEALIAEVQKKH
jgi:serine/threonine-protein kinase